MSAKVLFKDVLHRLGEFRDARQGNVAIIFALAILPIIGFIGAAVDYTRVINARSSMQAALDSTALMISKDVGGLSADQVTQKAQSYFNALYNHPEVSDITVSAAYAANGGSGSTVVVNGSGAMATNFMKVAGYPNLNFGVGSTVTWGNTRLRVALALDNTGSMASAGKMSALQSAAKSLIDQLKTAAKNDGDVYISIIPFAKDVNVGTTNVNADWLRWDLWEGDNGSCSKKKKKTKSDCLDAGETWTPDNHNTWNGCVTDRDQNYDTLSTTPTSNTTRFPAEQFDSCPTQIMPLTYDWTALKNKVDAMSPAGNTNQAIGMAWGWLSLLQQSPLNAPAEDSNYKYNKVVILLSDGDNTENRFSTSDTAIDARQKLLCDNAKAAGIQIYTIQVNTDGSANSSVMSYCASGSSNYFSTTSANGIATAFDSIGTALSKLRVAK